MTTNEMIGNGLLLFASIGFIVLLQSLVLGVIQTGKPPMTRLWRFSERPFVYCVVWLLYLLAVAVLGPGGVYLMGLLPGVAP